MSILNKFLALICGFIVLSSVIMLTVQSANAQIASKPSIPEFNVKLVDNSYYQPATNTTNSYTGETITNPGYRVEERLIEITIKNQPFTAYKGSDGYERDLYLQVQFKGHFDDEKDWKDLNSIVQSNSQYTTLTIDKYVFLNVLGVHINALPVGSQLDFRVEAVIGHNRPSANSPSFMLFYDFVVDTSSDWSATQTVSIPDQTASTHKPDESPWQSTPNPAPTTTVTVPSENSPTTPNNNDDNNSNMRKVLLYVFVLCCYAKANY